MSDIAARSWDPAHIIESGAAVLGIELGSTRIKATLIGSDFVPLASGSFTWENELVDGIWTYDLNDVWNGLAACFADLSSDVSRQFGVTLTSCGAIGISGMMHGYVVTDEAGNLLTPFRTWRNNITERASEELTALFSFPIPQRWSIAHLYQAILNGEAHVPEIRRLSTLAAYVHWKLTGEFAIGTNEASGMFPVDPETQDFDREMITRFDEKVAAHGFPWTVRSLLPTIVPAGTEAGILSEAGARLLDPSGKLAAGIPLCAPEGDAGTGMVATNSTRPRTGNVSAGTSVFAMLVLEQSLKAVHPEIDIVLTPDGYPVGMAHSNNCTSDFDAWMGLFVEAAAALGHTVEPGEVFAALMPLALQGDTDAGDLLSFGYVSGEHITGFTEGRPLFVRSADSRFTLANFVRAHLYSALCALRTGLDILTKEEGVSVEEIRGHGGFFKTPEVGQRIMAAATGSRVSTMETAGEGGSWGMALLAAYMKRTNVAQSLADFLDGVFAASESSVVEASAAERDGFERYFARYTRGLAVERAAVDQL